MNCEKCGMSVSENIRYCPNCGNRNKSYKESMAIGWGIIGFFIPAIGFVLAFAFLSSKPKAAKYAGLGAFLSVFSLGILKIILE